MESERERLERLYAELGDEHLQDLAAEPDVLTDDARLAVAHEMHRRGFAPAPGASAAQPTDSAAVAAPVAVDEPERESGFGAAIPGIIPSGASAVEQALEPGGEVRKGMARLLSFYDGHELTRGCEALEAAGVEFAVEEIAGDAMSGLPPHFEIWVAEDEQEDARDVLRQTMGLFPPPENIEDDSPLDAHDFAAGAGTMVVGEFASRAEAEEVRAMLAAEGFTAVVEGGRSSDDSAEPEDSLTVTVPAGQHDRALEVLAHRLGVE